MLPFRLDKSVDRTGVFLPENSRLYRIEKDNAAVSPVVFDESVGLNRLLVMQGSFTVEVHTSLSNMIQDREYWRNHLDRYPDAN